MLTLQFNYNLNMYKESLLIWLSRLLIDLIRKISKYDLLARLTLLFFFLNIFITCLLGFILNKTIYTCLWFKKCVF